MTFTAEPFNTDENAKKLTYQETVQYCSLERENNEMLYTTRL